MSWDELVASALVGTARRAPALPVVDSSSALGQVLDGVDREDPEAAVLEAGAVLGLYRLAGARPSRDAGPPLPPCPPEHRPICSEAVGFRLDAILSGGFRPVLDEWLELAAGAGLVVPPDRLPALLDTATSGPALRPLVAEVAGERGRWLGGLEPGWAWVAGGGPDDATVWATGSADARRLLLARLRSTDPAAGRELLTSTWATETPEDRAAFVATLASGLSLDDEPFLEKAPDARRKAGRHAAAGLLWRLPGSRLAGRMAERLLPLLRTGDLPTEVDREMARDGIVAKPPAGVGERSWWLQQLVAAAPLRIWSEVPADTTIRQALAAAAALQRDERWALALLGFDDVHEPALLQAVPPERAREVTADRVRRFGLTPTVLDLLDNCPRPWGYALSATVVERLGQVVTDRHRDPALRSRLPGLALRLDPAVPRTALAEHTEWWSDVVGWLLDLLTFRAEMREELPS